MTNEENERWKVYEGTVLTIPNFHVESCGKPPNLKAGSCYTAYAENHYGEQMVFQYDHKTKKGNLWHGDYRWEEPIPVMAGSCTIILSQEERSWLRLVWEIATEGESREFHLRSALDLVKAHVAITDKLLIQFGDDPDWKRSFLKDKRRLEKQRKAFMDELIALQVDEAAGRKTGG